MWPGQRAPCTVATLSPLCSPLLVCFLLWYYFLGSPATSSSLYMSYHLLIQETEAPPPLKPARKIAVKNFDWPCLDHIPIPGPAPEAKAKYNMACSTCVKPASAVFYQTPGRSTGHRKTRLGAQHKRMSSWSWKGHTVRREEVKARSFQWPQILR